MTIEPFREKHIIDAVKLFKVNFSNLRDSFTYLPNKFENLDFISKKLKDITSENPSFVALESNKIVGYMTGYSNISELKGSFTGSYTPEWAHSAITDGYRNIYEELYRTLSGIWSNQNNYTHIISFLKNVDLIETLSMLGFGMQVIDAVRTLNPIIEDPSANYTIEQANKTHIAQLKEMQQLIDNHLESPPIFLKRDIFEMDDQQIINEFIANDKITLIAKKEDEIISCIRGTKNDGNISLIQDKGTFAINFGYTKKEYRNTGISAHLLNEIILQAKKEGATFCSVDFESQNIEGRNFWLKYFQPIVYSMMRKIDDRI